MVTPELVEPSNKPLMLLLTLFRLYQRAGSRGILPLVTGPGVGLGVGGVGGVVGAACTTCVWVALAAK